MAKFPKQLKLSKDNQAKINLIVHGQCTFIFENTHNLSEFQILNNDQSDGLHIKLTIDSVSINRLSTQEQLVNQIANKGGLTNANGAYYWFSLDSQNQRLYLGIGEPRLETVIYQYVYENASNKLFLESLTHISSKSLINPLKLLRDPITQTVPNLVKNTNDLTMDDIAQGRFLPHSNLSSTAQILYECISGKNFVLNTPEFPDFTKAIEYSIKTEGCWCNKRLKEKSTEFNKDKPNFLETYLRITLGQNNGESPGIPYVMEIWPSNHYSPIHNHSSANAIIRVLNGTINVSQYPFLCTTGVEPFAKANFVKDDITWISPTLNQTHQLRNLEKTTCITIQCYMYENDDVAHYDYFDYIDINGERQQYEPDSDMDFVAFKTLMKREWSLKQSILSRFLCKSHL
jgi:hypothetical protein